MQGPASPAGPYAKRTMVWDRIETGNALILRTPKETDLAEMSALCLRSKAHWGYDAAFMTACVPELTLMPEDLRSDTLAVAEDESGLAGVAQVSFSAEGCWLEKLFVEPKRMGEGVGRLLFNWSVETARHLGAAEMIVEADPSAAPFYERMGCFHAGDAPSGSIPGRRLPRLVYALG